jgi:hypothetical protein
MVPTSHYTSSLLKLYTHMFLLDLVHTICFFQTIYLNLEIAPILQEIMIF